MAQNHPVCVESPFGRSRGPRGIDDQCRIVGPGLDGLKRTRGLLDRLPKIDPLLTSPCLGHQNGLQFGKPLPDFQNLIQICAIGHEDFGLTVGQSIFQGVGAKKSKNRNGNRPDLVNRNMGKRRLGTLG